MNHQAQIESIQRLIDARRSGSLTIKSLQQIKEQIRLDEMKARSGAPKPRYRVPARKRVN